jgi:hypothetical protein
LVCCDRAALAFEGIDAVLEETGTRTKNKEHARWIFLFKRDETMTNANVKWKTTKKTTI